MKQAVTLVRVSSTKQATEGESLEVQAKICQEVAESKGYKVIKTFEEDFSGRKKNRPVLVQMLSFLEQNNEKVEAVFVRDIDRLTRGGASSYMAIKETLQSMGIELFDTFGIIQPTQNTLSDLDFEYDWSKKSPSRMAEHMKADMANEEVTTILTRMIGQEIRLAQKGYQVRPSNIGYQNVKITDEYGKKKTICKPHPEEAIWIRTIFELRAEGIMTDPEICEKVNGMGFKTRYHNKKDKLTGKIIGKTGGCPLTPKRLQEYVKKTVYCGVIIEKWTHYQPIRCPYPGLVSIDVFNKANRGKVFISEGDDGSLSVEYDLKKSRIRHNPMYPYRFVVMCPKCRNPLVGSASTGKMGKKYPAYHCNRGHYFRIPQKKFNETVESFAKKIQFIPEFLDMFEVAAIDVWRSKQKQASEHSIKASENVNDLKARQNLLLEQIINTDSKTVKKMLEKQIEELDIKIENAKNIRSKTEVTEDQIRFYIKHAKHLMEHPAELLLRSENYNFMKHIWGLFFHEFPTYQEILDGTPKMSLVFKLCGNSEMSKFEMVGREGFEPPKA